ncbi:hypothetical protein ACFXOS_31640 [Streptomyces sp. NPDC059175]|uniref:hypothetical protein n=1 Tax=Streptomyces sp. NPDC059175 TaxID=3346757 RepID=UPI0036C2D26D
MRSQPIVGAAVFTTVMEAAGFRCQCAGECGNAHAKGDGRCPHEHDHYTSKHGRRVRLMAAPVDPLASRRARCAHGAPIATKPPHAGPGSNSPRPRRISVHCSA